MKKHDEGYILAYVFVILTAICIIAVSVLTIPLTNFRIQQASVKKMQDQYAAQGMIEEALAELVVELPNINLNNTSTQVEDMQKKVEKCPDQANGQDRGILCVTTLDEICQVEKITGNGLYVTSDIQWSNNQTKYSCRFTFTAVYGSVIISSGIELQDVINGTTIVAPKIKETSYSISTFGAPTQAPTGGGGSNE